MLKSGIKSFLVFLILFTALKCIDPFYPKLNGYKPLLVVEGLITDSNSSYTIRLSNTKQTTAETAPMVSDAVVSIMDEVGNKTSLTPSGNGIYKTDSLTFRGEVGKTYRLNIKTSNGKEYESDSCTMMPVPPIDSIYFDKDVKLTDNNTVTRQGLSVLLDSKGGVDDK